MIRLIEIYKAKVEELQRQLTEAERKECLQCYAEEQGLRFCATLEEFNA